MAHHAQHARSPKATSRTRLSLPRLPLPLLGLAAVAGATCLGVPAAHAAATSDSADVAGQREGLQELGAVPLYPLANTPADLLSNNLRVPVGGTDLSTFPVTAPLHDGLPVRDLPLLGTLLY